MPGKSKPVVEMTRGELWAGTVIFFAFGSFVPGVFLCVGARPAPDQIWLGFAVAAGVLLVPCTSLPWYAAWAHVAELLRRHAGRAEIRRE